MRIVFSLLLVAILGFTLNTAAFALVIPKSSPEDPERLPGEPATPTPPTQSGKADQGKSGQSKAKKEREKATAKEGKKEGK
jgi:hypothetical protein